MKSVSFGTSSMANVRGGVIGERTRPRSYVVEEFVPLSTCAEVLDCHYLIFSLPGFKKEDVRIQVVESGDVVNISGEKRVNEKKYMYFEKKFKVPENCEVSERVRELEGHVLYVIFPKKGIEKKRSKEGDEEKEKPSLCDAEKEKRNGSGKEEERREKVDMFRWDNAGEKMSSVWRSGEKMVRERRGLILTALLAISLVVLVSHRLKSHQLN